MHLIDWIVVFVYLLGMLIMAAVYGRSQNSGRDYFLGANRLSPLSLAASTVATQCSTNSLLGAPAFVGFSLGGGLIWMQYELAVPLAMLLLVPLLANVRESGHVSIYAFLEQRLGPRARLLASTMFLIFRGIATGVTVYGVAILVTLIVDISYTQAVLLLMAVTIAYDVMGGMRAVVVSDVVQLVLIVVAVGISFVLLLTEIGGVEVLWAFQADSERGRALDFSWGLAGSGNFGFWPMLLGGLFLYMAYYGCDQSQAQRVLASRSAEDAQRVLLYSGLLRFPIVFLYCLLGLALAVYAAQVPEFVGSLPSNSVGTPNFNLVFPAYVLEAFPVGLVGLVLVGVVAAAMSSIDSSLNALSAATMEDHIRGRWQPNKERQRFVLAKAVTVLWGLFAVAFSYQVEAIAPTILEAINKIGSVANGPLLGLFLTALLMPRVGERRAIIAFAIGFASNVACWLWLPQVSWLWWNVIGCLVALAIAGLSGAGLTWEMRSQVRLSTAVSLLAMMGLILVVSAGFGMRTS
ncbi:MAG: sodium/solute symporter [Pseudomonadota bacterium]